MQELLTTKDVEGHQYKITLSLGLDRVADFAAANSALYQSLVRPGYPLAYPLDVWNLAIVLMVC
jgi:hypothetical protein